MNISQLVQNSLLSASGYSTNGSKGQASATSSANKTGTPLDKANSRLQSQLDSTTAQLSSFGKLKSAVAGVQQAAKALAATTGTSAVKDVRAAASDLVDSFNATVITAIGAAALPGATASDVTSTRRITRDLGQTLTGNTAVYDSLKKLGFRLETDGTLSVDDKKFDAAQKANPAAVQATMAKLGQLLDKTATNELASSGSVNNAIASLSQRSKTLQAQQSAMQSLVNQMQVSGSAASTSYGLAAYLKNSV